MVTSISETTRLWEKALKKIEERLGEKKTFETFFSDTFIDSINGNTIVVSAKNEVSRVLLSGQYKKLVTEVLSDITEDEYNVVFVAPKEVSKSSRAAKNNQNNDNNKPKANYFEGSEIKPDLTFANFVVGDFNKEAHKAALYVARNGGTLFNPLFIYSHSGLGKTHLLHAIANEVKASRLPDAKILYTTANDFVEAYVRFVKGETGGESLKEYFKSFDILLFDDIQFLEDKVKTEEMFFTVYQYMINSGKRVIITSDRQPIELKGLEDRLVTRFKQGLTVNIGEPNLETCAEIFISKMKERGISEEQIDPTVINFFASKFNKDVRELEGAANSLVFYSLSLGDGERITMDMAIKAVGSIKGGNEVATQLSEQKIINTVASYYRLEPSQLTSKVRTGQIALARHIAMYLIRNHLDVPLKKIGDMFGGKDHTTVMSGISKVDKELKTDTQLKKAIEELEKKIKE